MEQWRLCKHKLYCEREMFDHSSVFASTSVFLLLLLSLSVFFVFFLTLLYFFSAAGVSVSSWGCGWSRQSLPWISNSRMLFMSSFGRQRNLTAAVDVTEGGLETPSSGAACQQQLILDQSRGAVVDLNWAQYEYYRRVNQSNQFKLTAWFLISVLESVSQCFCCSLYLHLRFTHRCVIQIFTFSGD